MAAAPTEACQMTRKNVRDLQQHLEALRTNAPGNRDETTRTHTRATVHLPKFAHSNPQLRFAQVERSFRLHQIIDDTDKFDLVTLHLEEDVVLAVEDLVIRPPNENKYVAIKNRLLQKFAESPESKLRRLLQGGGTSGLKPSEILANMRRLAPDPGSENIILTLFLAEMPASIRPTLTVWEETDLDKLAKIADKMLEAVNHNATFAISTNNSTAAAPPVCATSTEDPWKKINDNLRSLSQKFDVLQKDVKRICASREALLLPRSIWGKRSKVPPSMFPHLVVKLKELSPDTLVGGSTNITSEPTVQLAVPQEQRLHVTDRTSHIRFLVDSGSVVSVIPRTLVRQKTTLSDLTLYAANQTVIHTYGKYVTQLNLDLRRNCGGQS
ncbi:uncharacterized protein [Drosophila suzukii]|uniref:DUF7041 domain-containing protein n=1 Tax=Drosophila suzukii TaxID=28584 RepID=A0ABM4TUQ5_DROSZ